MLIKSGLDHKSRWNLDDNEGDDPHLEFVNGCTIPDLVQEFLRGAHNVYCLHPRLVSIARGIAKKPVGSITVTQTTRVTPAEFTEFDGEDFVPEPETHQIKYEVPVFAVGSAALVELPAIDIELCGTFAKTLVPLLEQTVVYTPGQVYGQGTIGGIYCHTSAKGQLAPVEPPSHIQGTTAALLSNAQRLGRKMTVVVAHADGPASHEVMHQYDIGTLKHMFLQRLGIDPTGEEPDVSALYL